MSSEDRKELEVWGNTFSHQIVTEVFSLIGEEETLHGKDFGITVALTIIANITSTLVFDALHHHKDKNNDKLYEFNVIKLALENVISSAIQAAWKADTGQSGDFYCMINKVPEPINKLEC